MPTTTHEELMRPLRRATTRAGTRSDPSAMSRAKLSKYLSLLAGTKNYFSTGSIKVPSATNQEVGSLHPTHLVGRTSQPNRERMLSTI